MTVPRSQTRKDATSGMAVARSRKEVGKCLRNSWYLATEYLGYAYDASAARGEGRGLTERVHKPICRWYDAHREDKRMGLFMGRSRHKTTLIVTWVIQAIMRDPLESHRYFHDDDGLAQAFLSDVAWHIRNNDKLRSLDPVGKAPDNGELYRIFPSKKASKWLALSKGSLRVDTPLRFGMNRRAATLQSQGVRTAVTGSHINGECWMDDVIGEDTVRNSRVQAVSDWYQQTVTPVVDSDVVRLVGTPWVDPSLLQEFWSDPKVRSLIIPGAIAESDEEYWSRMASGDRKIHFAPDYKFTNPMHHPEERKEHGRRQLRDEQERMKSKFSPQIMIDSEPESERPWSKACENITGLSKTDVTPGVEGPGQVFVLSDPAPFLEGGYRGLTEKIRGDGSKDYWSICVVKLRVRGLVLDIILLDGDRSQGWSHRQGAERAAKFMRQYGTSKFFSENPKEHHPYMLAACLVEGVSLTRAKDGGPLKFKDYNRADGKNARIIQLATMGSRQEFWICTETCSPEFLNGDKEHTGFLTQVRKFRKVGQGKTNLRFDDDADVVARATDPALMDFSPKPHILEKIRPMSPFRSNESEPAFGRAWGKHIRA